MIKTLKALIFDVDGTILDSADPEKLDSGPGRAKAIVEDLGFPIPENINDRIKKSWAYGDLRSTIIQEPFNLSEEVAEQVFVRWHDWDIEKPQPLIKGADNLVRKMRNSGFVTAILTSRGEKTLARILDHHRLTCFHYVFSRDDCQYKKPDCRAVNELMDCLDTSGITKENCLGIGDTPGDVKCFNEAGIEFVAVETGLYKRSDFLQAGLRFSNIVPSVIYLEHWLRDYGHL